MERGSVICRSLDLLFESVGLEARGSYSRTSVPVFPILVLRTGGYGI